MVGRTIGYALAFATPLALPRVLSQAEIGTYKHLFLLYGTLYGLGQIGMAESLYFFLPRSPQQNGRYIANALLMLAASGLACAGFAWLAAPAIAHRMNDPALVRYLPAFGIFLALAMISAGFEIVMVSRQEYRSAAMLYAASDAVRAAFVLVPALVLRSVGALVGGIIAFGLVRCGAMSGYLSRRFRGTLRPDRTLWKEQLRYALPFSAAGFAQFNLNDYLVSFWVDSASFAIYSYGCLDVPLVNLVGNSYANVLMVRMGDELRQGRPVAALWRDVTARLALVFFPLTVALILTAHELFAALFPPSYAASVPVFIASSLSIALAAFPIDAVLRVYAEIRLLIVLNVLRLVVMASTIWWLFHTLGLPGAVLVAVLASLVVKTLAVGRIGRLMDLGARGVLPWRSLGLTAGASLVAVVPAAIVRSHLSLPPLFLGAATTLVYAVVYLALMAAVGLLPRPQMWQRWRVASRAEGQ
jgi:O-antigen/teichoic acid export membrane protein